LAEKAGWDKSILATELQNLLTIESDFDVTITGFEIPEIDILLTATDDKRDPHDDFEVTEMSEPITRSGDLWQLGRHRILCGSSIEQHSFSKLFGNKRAGVVFVDPPYNVEIGSNVSGKGSTCHREFKMASGEMSEFEFISFLTSSLRLLALYSASGSVHFVCMDWRHIGELLNAGRQVYESLLNVCIWVKNNGGMGSFYRSRHELVFVFRNGKAQHRNNVRLGRYGRNRTNVWEYPSVNTLSKVSDEGNLLALHPTVKPVALVADALLDCSSRDDVVLDSFLGSGSTLIAAERTGHSCYGIEIDPIYVDTAIKRWQRYTGDHAVHAVSGIRFDEISTDELEKTHG
jgi:DNA modification methylase